MCGCSPSSRGTLALFDDVPRYAVFEAGSGKEVGMIEGRGHRDPVLNVRFVLTTDVALKTLLVGAAVMLSYLQRRY